jgi:DNA-binding MurR/RpiR family transcriptional regulator
VFTASHVAGALLGAAFAILLGLGSSLLLARFGQQRLMRWPAAVATALAIVAAAVLGARLA